MRRTKRTTKFKTKVVLEALKEIQSTAELAQKYSLHPSQISTWKREFLNNAESVFEKPSGLKKNKKIEAEQEKEKLLQIIGQQKVELDFLKDALR